MANYTQSIREIMQFNKLPSESLENVADVYAISMRSLFNVAPIDMLKSAHRENFVTGFTLHFMNDEIGLETLPLWKIALNEKIYNYGSYIDAIYDNLDKQVFADYAVSNKTNNSEHSIEKEGSGTIENVKSETISGTSESETSNTGTVTNAKSGTDTIAKTGTVANAKTGTDTLSKTGTDTKAKTGTDAVAKTGQDAVTRTGTEADAHTGTQGTVDTNSQDTTYEGTQENTGHTDNDRNMIQIQSDTPMGSLLNLRTPGGAAKGTGVNYANGQTYNYMSGAQEVDESNVQTDAKLQTDNSQQSIDGSSDSTTTYNDTMTKTRNLTDTSQYGSTDTTTFGSTETDTLALQDQTTYNNSNLETNNLQDLTTYNNSNLETRALQDTTQQTDQTETQGTDTQTRSTTDSETGTNSETGHVTDYRMNWEMLYKSMPLLNKVWEIFDDLFMQIY